MRIRDAANLARAGVIVHLVLHVITWLLYLGPRLQAATHGAVNALYFLGSLLSLVGGVALDVGLLIILSSLCRTTEGLIRDNPDA